MAPACPARADNQGSDVRIVENARERAAPQRTHGGVGATVIPDETHGLLECPGSTALPQEVLDLKTAPKGRPSLAVEKMPHGHQIQRRICWSETAAIKHSDKTRAPHEKVWWDKVLMTHHDRPSGGQLPEPGPQIAQSSHIKKALAVFKANSHPIVMIGEMSTTSLPVEASTSRVCLAQRRHEVCKVKGERRRST